MKICYVDESGCTGVLTSATSPIQPVLLITGLIIDVQNLPILTNDLLKLKQRFFPNLAPSSTTHMGWMLKEIKGGDLRKDACEGGRNLRRHALGYLGEVVGLVERVGGRLVGRVWIKGIGAPLNGNSVYNYSIQSIYADFQDFLVKHNDYGTVIVDSRLKHLNTAVAHSIFTQKFKVTGDAYNRVIELPAFSHSDNHAGLQVADTLSSAVMAPMAIHTYCVGHVTNVHVRPRYAAIKDRFKVRCQALQHRYNGANGHTRGGYIVSDALAKRPGGLMFR